MLEEYNKKIKTPEELKDILGNPPRKKKVIMCHGTFDVVHPGHVRHLAYAKEKAEILIASITADEYVGKGEGKPYVPEELRAKNLAALEMVDYVIIDYHPKPLENLKIIKPDFFIKGFEYTKEGIRPKTREEIDLVSSYGGKVIFSPGDIVYSSTGLQNLHKPKISFEKLLAIMDTQNVNFDDVLNTLDKVKKIKVHVIGDTIIDKYSYCTVLGPTTKTPTFSVKLEKTKTYVGGAGVVAKHFKSLGADVTFTTVLGDDETKDYVLKDLEESKIIINGIIDKARPTTIKERFWASGYKLLQVDTVDNRVISEDILKKITEAIDKEKPDIIVFSDFRHGIFNKNTVDEILRHIPKDTVKVADSQVSNRWGNILDFRGMDIIFPNEKEARFALADQDNGVRPLACELYKKSGAKYLVLKLSEKGILLYLKPGEMPRNFLFIESFVEDLIDGLGAGDAMLSMNSLAYKASGNFFISSILGNIAAAVACESEGNDPITIDRIKEKVEKIRKNNLIQN